MLTGAVKRIHPHADPKRLWLLQSTLIAIAESFFGERDSAFTIAAPKFNDNGPCLQHALEGKQVWVELSENAAKYWPTAVYELAHECVHLLNPVIGYANFLEEGFAVAFQHDVAPALSGEVMRTSLKTYLDAERYVNSLDENVFLAGKMIRKRIGSFSAATEQNMVAIFPRADQKLLQSLVSECRPR